MKINDILDSYKNFFLATEDDNQGILDFFKSSTMDTKSISLRYDRGSNFYDFTKEQSAHTIVFVIKDDNQKIKGTASIAFIPHFLNGTKVLCAYLGDLRISPLLNAKIRILWKKCYSDLITNFSNIDEFHGVKYLYSAILNDNQNAMKSLLKNNDQIIYHHLTPYEAYNVIRPKPNLFNFENKYLIKPTSLIEIKNFLLLDNQNSGLNTYVSNDSDCEITRRITSWKNLNSESFQAVFDENNNIVAIFAPWKCNSKKLVIERVSLKQKIVFKILSLFGIPEFKEKKAINVLYLTHLTFNKTILKTEYTEIITTILFSLFKQKRDFHVISFLSYPQWELKNLPFFMKKTKANFYQVMSKKQFEEKDFINLNDQPPAFEIGIA